MKLLRLLLASIPLFLSISLSAAPWELGTKLEDGLSKQHWKKVQTSGTPEDGLSEWIPGNQTLKDFKEMVSISSYDLSKMAKRPKSATEFVEVIRRTTYGAYPGGKIKWNVIRQSPYDVIYEWQLVSKYNGLEPFHEISRIVFQGNQIYQVIYTHKGSELESAARDEWIKKLEGKPK